MEATGDSSEADWVTKKVRFRANEHDCCGVDMVVDFSKGSRPYFKDIPIGHSAEKDSKRTNIAFDVDEDDMLKFTRET
ncbi:hypothetical protein GOBAR_AA39676 [Gossypium barbadense]|uniref:Uncharacterized protein n=1 Tax=Gossypium barbadense TaxID=3634 RepID=A0A2P5R0H2_GOSBA|nr:hypothetical protein GOBAR_DD22756 [Gossypium barbadense]PPR81040.1 hypothetical protein GOBAR_AA39676 [Gossypium barbadense]